MPVIVATVIPLPEHRDEVKKILVTAIEAVHGEDGCELYSLHENKDRFVFVEKWASPAALGAHAQSPALAAMGKDLEGKLSSALDVVILEPVPAGDPAKGQLRS